MIVFYFEYYFDMISLFHVILSNDGFVAFHYKSCGTFFLHSKSSVTSITSMVVLPTTEIIELVFLSHKKHIAHCKLSF